MSEMFVKLGQAQIIAASDICSTESVFSDPNIEDRFVKFAATLRRIAPKADEFLYFSCVMLHSAEASIINSDGSPKLTSKGDIVTASWEKKR